MFRIPKDGITLEAAFDEAHKRRNASFLALPLPSDESELSEWLDKANTQYAETLAEFIADALGTGNVKVFYVDANTNYTWIIPHDILAKHKPFAGVVSSLAGGTIKEPIDDPLSEFNGCQPYVLKSDFEKWLSRYALPQRIDPPTAAQQGNRRSGDADLERRLRAVLEHAKGVTRQKSKNALARVLIAQKKNEGFSRSALTKILANRYGPMLRRRIATE